MQYVQVGAVYAGQPITATPLLCGNTSAPADRYAGISPVFYSATGKSRQTPAPFVLGSSSATPSTPAAAMGGSIVYANGGSTLRMVGDPSLVCYGLDGTGVHGPTPGVMRDQFEGSTYSPTLKAQINSTVVLTVFHVPSSSTDYYGYTLDVTLPPVPSTLGTACANGSIDCNFALIEGFDSGVFATNTGGWCLANAGATSCPGSTTPGGINLNYTNFNNNGLPALNAPVSPNPSVTYHFVVKRFFASGVTSLPANNDPIVLAALFSPFDLDENYIGDNVAAGYTNTPPTVVQNDAAWSTFSTSLSALVESVGSSALTFNISDADTPEPSGGPYLTAAVTLNLNGVNVAVTPTCTPTSGAGVANRQCSFNIPLDNAGFWDGSVGAAYRGLFNAVATDTVNGTYAGGVLASAQIVVTDSSNKSSAPVSVPIHINSSANDPPVVTFGSQWANVADPLQTGSPSYPTFTCAISLGANPGGCGTAPYGSTSLPIDLGFAAQPGPPSAFDELAVQTTLTSGYADPNGGNVSCTDEQASAVFIPGYGPLVTAVSGTRTANVTYDMIMAVPAAAPTQALSTLCTLSKTIRDQAALAPFPNGEVARLTTAQFRIVINP